MLLPENDGAAMSRASDSPAPEPGAPSASRAFDLLEQELGDLVWETDSRLRYEQALAECARALLTSPRESTLEVVLNALLSATDASYAFIERNVDDPELGFCSRTVQEVERSGLEEPGSDDYWNLVPWDRMPTSRAVLEKGKPFAFLVADLKGPERELYLGDAFPVVAELDIPIFVRDRWVGLIGFANKTAVRAWSDEDLRLLEVAAALIGSYWDREDTEALLRENLRQQERRVRRERALSRCSAALLKSGTEDALDVALNVLLEATESSSVFVERNVDHPDLGLCSSMILEAPPADSAGIWEMVPWSSMPISHGRLSRGEPFSFLIKDLTGVEAETYARSDAKSELDIPIVVEGEWVGLVGFTDRVSEREWDAEEVEFLRTVSEMIAAFWERRAAYEKLEQLVRSKDEFIASVSHELRTPLTVVVGLANEMKEGFGQFTDDELSEFIGLVAGQGNEVANIVEDLLVIARADIDRITVLPEAVDLAAHVRAVFAGLEQDEDLAVIGQAPPAWCDPGRLRQIVRNLLTNAVRYGGKRVRVELGVIGDQARVEVCDDGEGIDEQDHDRVFEAYHRAHDRRGQPASVGLGLTVSKRLAELMGGDLTYYRRDGWSVFALSLPVATEPPAANGFVPG
jgi:signal transduction histidine kinase